jgi:hypothetical protein
MKSQSLFMNIKSFSLSAESTAADSHTVQKGFFLLANIRQSAMDRNKPVEA